MGALSFGGERSSFFTCERSWEEKLRRVEEGNGVG